MKKALLADDDFLVRSYLKMLSSWEKAGFDIAADVRDGEEALDFLKKERVELVVTDIAMPLMDGIELIREIRKKYPEIYIIVLSCHDDFEYVKEAMKEGADEYVLKNTLNEDSLYTLLKAAGEKIESRPETVEASARKVEAEAGSEEELTKINRQFLYFNQILAGTLTPEEQEQKRIQAGIRGKYVNSAVIVMQCGREEEKNARDPWAEIRQEQYCLEFLTRIQQSLEKMPMAAETEKEVIYLGNGFFCCFIDFSEVYKGSLMYQKLTNMASACYKICGKEEPHFQIGVSNICIGSEALRQAYQQARKMVKAGFYEKDNIVYYEPDKEMKKELPAEAVFLAEQTGRLRQRGEKEEFLNMSRKAVGAFLRERTESSLVLTWLKKLEQQSANQNKDASLSLDVRNIDEVSPALSKIADLLFEYTDADVPQTAGKVVKTAIWYAQNHYREPIGLNDAAEAAGVNSTYLSYLFGKEMGIGFSGYLLNLRLSYAKKLLRETNLKIWQIGQKAGFNDYHYFSKVFKKTEGMSPAKYRRAEGGK